MDSNTNCNQAFIAVVDSNAYMLLGYGSLTLSEVGSSYEGSFDVQVLLEDGGFSPLTGTFSAPLCSPGSTN